MQYRFMDILLCTLVCISITSCSNIGSVSPHDSILESTEYVEDKGKSISEMTEEEILNSKEFKAKMREFAPIYAKQKVRFKMLCSEWSRCKTNKEKRLFIDKHEYEVGMEFDVDISTIAKAENLFVTHTKEFFKVLELKLKAQAAKELAEENYQKAYELRYSE